MLKRDRTGGQGPWVEVVRRRLRVLLVVRLVLPSWLGGPRDGTRGLPEAREVRPPCGSTSLLSSGGGTGVEANRAEQRGAAAVGV